MAAYGWQYLTAHDKAQIARGVRDGNAYGGPYHVEVHPADRCNIDCFFCSTAAIRGRDELPAQRFESLVGELKAAGTRSLRLSGGGEPLFHRRVLSILHVIRSSQIPIENITTNAVLMTDDVATVLTETCDQVTISLNTADPESYASMMRTPARNFHRVLANIRRLVEIRKQHRARRPSVNVQFLVWRENFASIPKMYDLAREVGADSVLFSGLSFLGPDQLMSDEQIAQMLGLYEEVIRRDEFRHIANIGSFERDLTGPVAAMVNRLSAERARRSLVDRAMALIRNGDSLTEKLRHHLRLSRNARIDRQVAGFPEACLIGWYSMLVRSTGLVAPCCILQHKKLGNIEAQSVHEIWYGDAYRRFRYELSRIIAQRESWVPTDDQTVEHVCGVAGQDLCPMKSFYYLRDPTFVRTIRPVFEASQKGAEARRK